ncbi:hypothetical protein AVEN_118437-1 [Araneus ventricosus]|uniref:Uncharacterized protein n=1 Tax=Araneus ventricosus TaxID=182803 RepID=A0A4Y2MAU5_ARAVE|nr:hypothetical protein AVEN_118437-1 [Araneus ventricosus]
MAFLSEKAIGADNFSGVAKVTLGLFWDGPRNFGRRQKTWTTPEPVPPTPSLRTTPAGGHLTLDISLTRTRLAYTTDLRWNPVSISELSGFKAEALPTDQT